KVQVRSLDRPAEGKTPADSLRVPDSDLPLWPWAVKTDDKGRFVLAGLGRPLTVHLAGSDDRLFLRDLSRSTADQDGAGNNKVVLPPAQLVEGRVTYEDTGKPVPHTALEISSYKKNEQQGLYVDGILLPARTDAKGRYRMSILSGTTVSVRAKAPDSEPYL